MIGLGLDDPLELAARIARVAVSLGGHRVKQAMVDVFSVVGQRSELADGYRARLARLLY